MQSDRVEHCLRLTGSVILAGALLSGLLWLIGLGEQAWFGFSIAGCFLAAFDRRRHREPRE